MALADIKQGLRAHLAADGPVAALVGTRIYPELLPQRPTLPAISYEQIGQSDEEHLQGVSALSIARMQVSAWSSKYLECAQLAQAIDTALRGYRGTLGTVTVYGVERDNLTDLAHQDGDNIIRRVLLDYSIWHKEI